MGVLDGVRVVEVAIYAYAPAAGAVLSDWGAEVVKVESPITGDPLRSVETWNITPGQGGISFLWEVCNRGKRSIALDLACESGREILMQLIDTCDVFVTNFSSEARQKLRIDVDDIRARNPTAIYARATAYGTRGPDGERGGFDGTAYWHRTGMGSAFIGEICMEPPDLPGPAYGDVQSGMHLAGGIAAALYKRERTGQPSVVDSSLFASGLWAMQASIAAASVTGASTLERASRRSPPNPISNLYATSDGRYIFLAMLESERYWTHFCEAIGRSDLLVDARFETHELRATNAEACANEIAVTLASQPLPHWIAALERQDGPWTVVNRVGDVLEDSQALKNGYICRLQAGDNGSFCLVAPPVQFDQERTELRRAPEHGEATEEILLRLGYGWPEIAGMQQENVIP